MKIVDINGIEIEPFDAKRPNKIGRVKLVKDIPKISSNSYSLKKQNRNLNTICNKYFEKLTNII